MKKLNLLATKLFVLGSIMALSLTSAHSASVIWQGNNGTLNSTGGGGTWNGAGIVPGTGDTAVFSANAGATTPNIIFGTAPTWGSMDVTQAGSLTITSNNTFTRTLTLGLGSAGSQTILTVGSGAGAVTIGDVTNTDDVNVATASAVSGSTYTISNAGTLTIANGLAVNVASGTGILAITGNGTSTFKGAISGATAVSIGAGQTTTFSVANSYTGTTTISGTLNANAAGALGTGNVNLSGGTLVFGNVSNAIASGANLTSTGGTITMTGTGSETLGTLTLSAGVTTINLGTGGTLDFSGVTFSGGTLVIDGWTGTTGGVSGSTEIEHSGGAALATAFAGSPDLSWNATLNGTSGHYTSGATIHIGGNNYQITPAGSPVTPAPEPSTIFFGLSLLALLAWGGREKLIEAGRSLVPARA